MAYKLIITERAEELLDNPLQFPICREYYLVSKGYHEAMMTEMDYTIIFSIANDMVYILGVFHQLENYQEKL